MKRMILTMLVGLMALGAVAQDGKFTVKGTFEGRGDSVNFVIVDVLRKKPIMSEKRAITGEMLEVSFELKKVALLYVELFENGNNSYMNAPAVPGEEVEFYREGQPITHLRGSQFYIDYNEAVNSIMAPYIRVMNIGVPDENAKENQEIQFKVAYQEFLDAVMAYVKEHPDQEASAALLVNIAEVGASSASHDIEAAASCLTERVANSTAANLYKECVRRNEARKMLTYQDLLERREALDFTLNDINGDSLSLSSLRGKWVVIDFWGSWCQWCIKGMPQMKEYYTKYKDKLEILGVNCRDTEEKWKAAVAEYELPWLHVFNDKAKGDKKNPLKLYAVRGFPTKVIVDPEGKVAKIFMGEVPAFYEYLDEVLNKESEVKEELIENNEQF